ncbi:MAG: hypothetical protein JO329_25005, partial [Planctomycetaceae bacterium]|nr:hypothetical protein [Planctomycetaceae bacterium]
MPAAANAPAAPAGANVLAAPAVANAPGVPAAAANAPGVPAAAVNAPGIPAGTNAPSSLPGANAATSPLGVNAFAPPAGANPVGQMLNYVMLNQMVSSPSNAGGAATPTNHASSSSVPVANPSGQTFDGSSSAGSASAPVASVGTSDSAANVPHPVVGVSGVGNATAGVNALGPSTVASTVNNGASGTNPTGKASNRAVPSPMSGAPGNPGGAAIPARHSPETAPLLASSPRGSLDAASGIHLPGWEANTLDIASGKRPLFSEGSVAIPPSAQVLADAALNQPAISASDQVRQNTGIGMINQTAEDLSIPQTVPEPAPLALLGITAAASACRFVCRRFRRRACTNG